MVFKSLLFIYFDTHAGIVNVDDSPFVSFKSAAAAQGVQTTKQCDEYSYKAVRKQICLKYLIIFHILSEDKNRSVQVWRRKNPTVAIMQLRHFHLSIRDQDKDLENRGVATHPQSCRESGILCWVNASRVFLPEQQIFRLSMLKRCQSQLRQEFGTKLPVPMTWSSTAYFLSLEETQKIRLKKRKCALLINVTT